MELLFNRTPLLQADSRIKATRERIQGSVGLWRASLGDAAKYGGSLTRQVLDTAPLTFRRKHIFVDVKVHHLMRGMFPSIPGWHTDGIPRRSNGSASGGDPSVELQASMRSPYYHLLILGEDGLATSRTEFLTAPVTLQVESGPNLYRQMTVDVEAAREGPEASRLTSRHVSDGQWTTFDWWDIHRGVAAMKREWRYLIRITETDYDKPNARLEDILRTHSQVYVPMEFGW